MTILIKNAERNDYNTLGDTLNPINDARRSTAIEEHQIILMRKKKFSLIFICKPDKELILLLRKHKA